MAKKANSTLVTASTTAEAVIGIVSASDLVANDPSSTGALVHAAIQSTSTTGTTVTYKVRAGSLTSATLFTSQALPFLTGNLIRDDVVEFVDSSNQSGNPTTYVITATGSASVTFNSITVSVENVSGAQ